MAFCTRFAPSPTGYLHTGHAYAAKIAHDLARSQNGSYLVRFEDIDHTRVRPEFYEAALEDLAWLSLSPDEEPLRQLDRLSFYQSALAQLRSLGVLYPCTCTRRDIATAAKAPHGSEGPVYPGTCRHKGITESDKVPRAWRLNAEKAATLTGPLTFHDRSRGLIPVQPTLLGDVILARKDIATSYHLAVVVDDAAQGVTLVTRGEDLFSSTHVHRLLQALLNLPEPTYLHHALITDSSGRRLAKRDSARSLRELRSSAVSPADILSSFPSPCAA